ncbi:DUF418 domain-containing protein [Bacillus sp. FJAT-22090]|uniref:DUF418 domain-containing protein n=1 Tax=Bacillus sp. FJAT-22090 TaxID=1581038 RepID=UPI00119E6059|nr:DUF418 domain-containing protein [Bacillus sp. FJAT-22090]
MKENGWSRRIDDLDYLRGFALLGIILVNILALLNINVPAPNTLDASYQRFLYLFVEGRFFTIFSFLFGVGIYLFLSRAIAKGEKAYILFTRRLIVLFLVGFIHALFHPGEALLFYSVIGFIVLSFYKVNKRINLAVGLILLITFALLAFKAALILPLMLLGLVCGQYGVFENLASKTKQLTIFTLIALLIGSIGFYIQFQSIPAIPFFNMIFANEDGSLDEASTFLKIGITVGPLLSAFYVGFLLVLLRLKIFQMLFAPLKYYGRMAFTNYLGQTIFILIASKLFIPSQLSYIDTLFICLFIYAFQLVFSMIWLRFFVMGPLEWVWRIVTYWRVVPLRRK